MTSIPIYDMPLIKQIMVLWFSVAKLLANYVDIVHYPNNHSTFFKIHKMFQ